MTHPLPFHLVNVFTSTPHAGSQAAVVVLPPGDARANDEAYKTALAGDFNLPATVFLVPVDETVPKYEMRWYTGAGELPLCGHGTLAASWVVFHKLHVGATHVSFEHPVQGTLGAELERESGVGGMGQGARIGFSLPITAATVDAAATKELTPHICKATGLAPEEILTVATYEYGSPSAVVQIASGVDLKRMKVNPKALGEHNAVTIITQIAGAGATDSIVRIDSRVFIPVMGLDEDTSTGSAHSVLTGFYLNGGGAASVQEIIPQGANVLDVTLEARQLSPRGGGMSCQLRDGRAWLVGQAWRVGCGELEVFE